MDGITLTTLGGLSESQLRRAYGEVLQPAIPPADLMTLEEICEAYLETDDPDPSAVVLKDGEPLAVMLGEQYAKGSVLLLSYLAVRRDWRGRGVGSRLVVDVLRGWYESEPCRLALAEVDDPRWHPGNADVGDAVARLAFYDRLGARLLPTPYFQPSLRPGSPRVPGMLLLRLDSGGAVPPAPLRDFLVEYFEECEGSGPHDDPAVASLVARVAALGDPGRLWPIARYTELPGPDDGRHSQGTGRGASTTTEG